MSLKLLADNNDIDHIENINSRKYYSINTDQKKKITENLKKTHNKYNKTISSKILKYYEF